MDATLSLEVTEFEQEQQQINTTVVLVARGS